MKSKLGFPRESQQGGFFPQTTMTTLCDFMPNVLITKDIMALVTAWSWYTDEVVVNSTPYVGVVSTTIVHPTMVGGGLKTLLMGTHEVLGGEDRLVVSKAPIDSASYC